MFALGSKARDTVTGFTGTVTARVEYLHGVTQFRLEMLAPDGKLADAWFEESRLAEPRVSSLPPLQPDYIP